MTPEQLKASILQYAMQGKITEQLPSDGSANDLLPSLIINKKIVANEAPYDIPDNWLWIPIGNLGASTDTDSFADGPFGSNLKTVHYINEPEVRIIQLSNIGEDGWKDKNVKYTSNKHLDEVIPRCEVHPGDLVIAKMMPAGRTIEVPDLGTRITLGSDAMKFVPNPQLNKKYLLWAMHSQAFLGQVYDEAHGITRVRTTLNGIKSYVLPIPPLAEQHRIVAKIEELIPFVDRYAASYEKLEQFNAKFPEDMKKSVLQYAIQGKLVEQRPEEGTAEDLYKSIQEEIKELEKAKLFKIKDNTPISDDEIPFDIPSSWKWVRIGQIINIESGKGLTAKQMQAGDIPVYGGNGITGYHNESLVNKETLVIGRVGFYCGSIHVTPKNAWITDNAFITTYPEKNIDRDYLVYVLRFLDLGQNSNATAQPVVSGKKIYPMLLPLPPLAEQKRIVKKIEETIPYCERLVK